MEAFLATPTGSAITSVALNVLSSGIWAILTKLPKMVTSTTSAQSTHPDPGPSDLTAILRPAAVSVSEQLNDVDPEAATLLLAFLSSPEVEEIVRQLFVIHYIPGEETTIPSLRQAFTDLFALHFPQDMPTILESADVLFTALSAACQESLRVACASNVLAAHDALSTLRYRLLQDQLTNIEQSVKMLKQPGGFDIDAILEFEVSYRKQVGKRHGFITPPNLDTSRKIPIEQLYVIPSFLPADATPSARQDALSFTDFLHQLDRSVILGNPGGGKSTLSDMVSHLLATDYDSRLVGQRRLTPIHVVLRAFGEHKQRYPCSLADFIELTANSKYQIPPPRRAFEYLLRTGRMLVIFDGLDELLDTAYRREISEDIETFSAFYPSTPILVTSRQIGYQQAPLDANRFKAFVLADFSSDQVAEYACKWFAIEPQWTDDERHRRVSTFIEESDIVPDLRSNPLMLALICNIYKGENYIPRNRPEVYEKCATMLFDRWDKSRGIKPNLPFEAHLPYAMKYLAHWLYTVDPLIHGVRDSQIVVKATEYLHEWLYKDKAVAAQAAREFVEFCKGRAWVFVDVGSTADGHDLYQFAHRTFLEYFTAAHLVRTIETPGQLYANLGSRIAKREWDVVAQLSFQLLNDRLQGAGDKLLMRLLTESKRSRPERAGNLLSFAGRSLEYLVPKPIVVDAIIRSSFDWILDRAQEPSQTMRSRPGYSGTEQIEILESSWYGTRDNLSNVFDSLGSYLVAELKSGTPERQRLVAQIILGFPYFVHIGFGKGMLPKNVQETVSDVGRQVLRDAKERVRRIAVHDRSVALLLCRNRECSVDDVANWHGVSSFFADISIEAAGLGILPLGVSLLDEFANPDIERSSGPFHRQVAVERCQAMSRLLCSSRTPWLTQEEISSATAYGLENALGDLSGLQSDKTDPIMDPSVTFLAFALLAVVLECSPDSEAVEQGLHRYRLDARLQSIKALVLARFEKWHETQEHLQSLRFDPEQTRVIQDWIDRRVDFVDDLSSNSIFGKRMDIVLQRLAAPLIILSSFEHEGVLRGFAGTGGASGGDRDAA